MPRNIRTLFNFEPPVTPEEIRAASIIFRSFLLLFLPEDCTNWFDTVGRPAPIGYERTQRELVIKVQSG
jgi:hypothetical protein